MCTYQVERKVKKMKKETKVTENMNREVGDDHLHISSSKLQ